LYEAVATLGLQRNLTETTGVMPLLRGTPETLTNETTAYGSIVIVMLEQLLALKSILLTPSLQENSTVAALSAFTVPLQVPNNLFKSRVTFSTFVVYSSVKLRVYVPTDAASQHAVASGIVMTCCL
jgi:hypothetical protein